MRNSERLWVQPFPRFPFRLWASATMVFLLAHACSPTVPDAIRGAFRSKFLNSRSARWKRKPNGDWLVSFYMEKFNDMTACYSPEGQLRYFELEVGPEEVPKELSYRIDAAFPDGMVCGIYERNMGNVTHYIFEIIDKGQLFGIYFEENANILFIPPDDYRFTSRVVIEND